LASTLPTTVSVVVPCRNAAPFLARTLAAIVAQSWRDLEIVLVDDGSTDNSVEVALATADDRLHVIRQNASGGPSGPRNRAIAEARGRYVFFCDADDIMHPGKIERQVQVFEQCPAVGMVFTDFAVIDAEGQVLESSFVAQYGTLTRIVAAGPGPEGGLRRELLLDGLLRANFIGTSGVAVRKAVLDAVGVFDTSLPSSEDLDLWLRIARRFPCAYLDMVGHGYRRHSASVMHDNGLKHPLARIEVMRRQLGPETTPEQVRLIRYWLGRNYCGLGYLHERRCEYAAARDFYLESLRARPNLQAAWGLAKMQTIGRLRPGVEAGAGVDRRNGE
jgi:glycosyltransferase involved in cell wall biosynthesis